MLEIHILNQLTTHLDRIERVFNFFRAQQQLPAADAFLSDVSDGKFDGRGTQYLNPGNQRLMDPGDRMRVFGP